MKYCKWCEETKPFAEFQKRKKNKDGYDSRCKSCRKIKKDSDYQKNKESILSKQREYYKNNKESVLARNKKYYDKNREKVEAQKKVYYEQNKEEILAYRYKWREDNRDRVNELTRKRNKERRQTDLNYKITQNLRCRLYKAVKGLTKHDSTLDLLGCSVDYLKEHLSSQFAEGMSWSNYGEWHIDHIVPCVKFNLQDKGQQYKCFHYTNFQPLWAKDNLVKGGS
jgi:hypothetical protein